MRAQVIYESMFGNSARVAEAIAAGIASHAEVELVEVGKAALPPCSDVDLIVVGGPTHAFGLSRPGTRRMAALQAEDGTVSQGIGIREWVAGVVTSGVRVRVAAFDTAMNKPAWIPGTASRKVAKILRRHGMPVVARPKTFWVKGSLGPLLDGELARAREWGEELAGQAVRAGEARHRR